MLMIAICIQTFLIASFPFSEVAKYSTEHSAFWLQHSDATEFIKGLRHLKNDFNISEGY